MKLGTGRSILLALALVALAASPSIVWAQGDALNPYGNSGYTDYREFSVPLYNNNPALPGQARLNREPLVTRPRANSYNQFANDDDDDFESSRARRGSSAGIPSNEAYQRLNRQYNRVYKPNDSTKNDEYVQRMKKRDEAFAKALKEKDPIKRAKLLRDLDNERLSGASARPKSAASSRAPEPNGSTSRPSTSRPPAASSTAPTPLGGERRSSSAPPPVSGVDSTRSGSRTGSGPPPTSGSNNSRPGTGGSPTTRRPPPDPSTIATPPPGE
jgi:hypothetical protein